MLRTWGRFQALVYSDAMGRRAPGGEADGEDPKASVAAEEVTGKFRSILAEHRGDAPVLVVLDTLEHLLHTERATLMLLLRELERVYAGEPGVPGVKGLRLVLAGRFDLAGRHALSWGGASAESVERVEGFRDAWVGPREEERQVDVQGIPLRLGRQAITLALPPFSDRDARQYLTRTRGVEGARMAAAMVDKAQGNPIKLSLLADELDRDPNLTAEEIEAYPNADLFHLVDRVIDRIEEPEVQWLVRWGVVPRLLTRDFVERVLWPLFLEHAEGRRIWDEPQKDDLPSTERGARRFSLDRDQDIYHELNRRALGYWQRLADSLSGPGRRIAQRGVVFHASEPWDGERPDAGELWCGLLEQAGTDRTSRAELARELLDVARRAGRPHRRGLRPPDPALVARAHAEVAEWLLHELRQGAGGSVKQLRSHLDLATKPPGAVEPVVLKLLEAEVQVLEGRQAEAEATFEVVLQDDGPPGELLRAAQGLAGLPVGPARGLAALERAGEVVQRQGSPAEQRLLAIPSSSSPAWITSARCRSTAPRMPSTPSCLSRSW